MKIRRLHQRPCAGELGGEVDLAAAVDIPGGAEVFDKTAELVGARLQVVKRDDLGIAEGTRLGKHASGFSGNVEPLRELHERRNRIEMVLRVDELVGPRIGVDKRLHIGGRAARSRDAERCAIVRRENLVKTRLRPLDRHGGTLVRPADDYADEVVGRAMIALLERCNALLVECGVVRDEVRRNFDDVGKLRRVVERRSENAVEGGKIVATRIEDDATLRSEPACKRLSRVESARASTDYSGGVGEWGSGGVGELRSSSNP